MSTPVPDGRVAVGGFAASTRVASPLHRIGLGTVLAVTVLLGACAENEMPAPGPRPVMVQGVGSVDEGQRTRRWPARIEAAAQTELGFMVQGRLARVAVEAGQAIEAGQVVAELDDTDYRIELRQAQVAERAAAADLERRRTLAAEGILAPAAVEMAQTEHANARAQREAAERQVAHTRLRAPYAGRVGARRVDPGTVVQPGEAVLGLQAGDGFDVVVELAERDAVQLPLDASLVAQAHLPAAAGHASLPLRYREHATLPAEGARTYRVVFRGEPPAGMHVLPGMAVQVEMPDPRMATLPPDTVRVPLSALLSDSDGTAVVWTVEDGAAQPRPVDVIELGDGWALVRGALADDAQVVVAGARQLGEGQAVEPRLRR